ncbi:NAD(P)H-binding protein [Halogeometricum sp. S1BR25-6]|jgi:putative NADH-flavin reductase|uniref:NAD(P)H-binding protein n=1 Tax=Halogeometricum salsisoli TaxID=2950536 RepID=A0ABU2GKH0_9EURY|nr:NAD(P)H-binding protein [Halogeometricum sp. S1BR25-6]MDS0301315.1 NAD(P)H-binding protein [Halogeometricum sp. S1BR25-6]
MRLAVFGATGGAGREFTKRATAEGHEIRALTRSTGRLSTDDAIVAVEGNVLVPENVSETVTDADAVVCLLGRTGDNPRDVVSSGTENILTAMNEQGVNRLVALTSMGLGASVRQVPWYVRLANATVLHDLMVDKARQEELVAGSDVKWTIVRPGGLTDGPPTGEFVHGVDVDATAGPISRADVAAFLLQVVQTDAYVREMPVVTTEQGVDAAFLWEQATAITRRLSGR